MLYIWIISKYYFEKKSSKEGSLNVGDESYYDVVILYDVLKLREHFIWSFSRKQIEKYTTWTLLYGIQNKWLSFFRKFHTANSPARPTNNIRI